jgi:hypothetical protein
MNTPGVIVLHTLAVFELILNIPYTDTQIIKWYICLHISMPISINVYLYVLCRYTLYVAYEYTVAVFKLILNILYTDTQIIKRYIYI